MPARTKKNPDRVELCRCVGKLMAYLRLGDDELAKQWAVLTVEKLQKMKLLPIDTKPPAM
jgi:hypothetical protein